MRNAFVWSGAAALLALALAGCSETPRCAATVRGELFVECNAQNVPVCNGPPADIYSTANGDFQPVSSAADGRCPPGLDNDACRPRVLCDEVGAEPRCPDGQDPVCLESNTPDVATFTPEPDAGPPATPDAGPDAGS